MRYCCVQPAVHGNALPLQSSLSSVPASRVREQHGADALRHGYDQPLPFSPASYCMELRDLAAAGRRVTTCIEEELDLERPASIHSRLWVAAWPIPLRLLHYQLVPGREIFATERMDLGLVWPTGRCTSSPFLPFLP
ncbi:hypothetical protein BKA56DRAFT_624070 [Ilyonectria sp. MPI-CAGE-AT-0026]|nr:hypothetical protein BKA56DRAFT_624070 [Ilyonectria sp. MPI-CAGE-AT-0026]